MDIYPIRFELLAVRARPGVLQPHTRVGMRIEHSWEITDDTDELTLTLLVTLEERPMEDEEQEEHSANRELPELAFAGLAVRYGVPGIREHRNAIPDALYLWIGHSSYDVVRGIFLAHAAGTVLDRILLPLPPDQAFLPDSGFRTISLN